MSAHHSTLNSNILNIYNASPVDAKLYELKTTSAAMASIIERSIIPAAAILLLAGHFAPWVAHKTAALTLSAHELAVFTHFTPGAGIFLNQWFYLPLWSAALIGAMLARGIADRVNRMLAALGCAVIASLGMPGYPQVLTAFRNPDFQLQFYLSLMVFVAVFVAAFAPFLKRANMVAAVQGALFAFAAVPLAGYLAVKPAIEQLFGESVGIGAGFWLTLLAVIAGVVCSLLRVRHAASRQPEKAVLES
ncbi:MAG TPA: hypothetical protein VGK87_06615 [Anaerolineae bacterium]